MCYPIGARLAQRRILALDTLYHHLFSTPLRDATTIDQLKHDLVLWLTHHSFEELPDVKKQIEKTQRIPKKLFYPSKVKKHSHFLILINLFF